MIAVFQTDLYGQIEIDTDRQLAYFKGQDYEAEIDKEGKFKDWNEVQFRVLMPIQGMSSKDATLRVMEWRTISRIQTGGVELFHGHS